jgi:hypothetical protein
VSNRGYEVPDAVKNLTSTLVLATIGSHHHYKSRQAMKKKILDALKANHETQKIRAYGGLVQQKNDTSMRCTEEL